MPATPHKQTPLLTKTRKITLHVLFWIVYAFVNFLLSKRVMGSQSFALGFMFVTVLINIALVYFHLLYLIPKYFVSRRYKFYLLMVLLAILAAAVLRLLGLEGVSTYAESITAPSFAYKAGMSISSSFIILFITMPFFLLEEWLKKEEKTTQTIEVDTKAEQTYFFIKSDHKLIKVFFDEITHVESLRDLVRIHTLDNRYLSQHSMRKMVEILPPEQFIRIHRSFIISFKKIKAVSGNMVETESEKIPIGKTYRESFFKRLEVL